MSEACKLGGENRDNIRNLNEAIELLKLKIVHLEDNTVKITTLYELQIEISEIKMNVKEMRGNREEDREQISKLTHSIEQISSIIEESFQDSAKLLAHQINYQKEQEFFKDKLDRVLDEVKNLNVRFEEEINDVNEKIKQSSIVNQFKTFYNKSKFNKWVSRLAILMLTVLIVSIFIFFTSGVVGADNLKKTMDFIKGWMM